VRGYFVTLKRNVNAKFALGYIINRTGETLPGITRV